MHPLSNKVALITGGSSGIGRATALRLAGPRAKVALAARGRGALESVVKAAQDLGTEVLAVPIDVQEAQQCRQAVEATVARFGRLDALVCSAGIAMRADFDGSDLAALEQVMRVNFLGTLYATHFALPYVKQSRGSLVALSSLTGLRGVPSYGIYGASKFAIQGLYESLRIELRRHGVHVGIFAPGFVDTPLRLHVLGPDGRPWAKAPAPPFRVWTAEKCADLLVRMLVRRRSQICLPWHIPLWLWLDQIVGRTVGNFILRYAFPPLGQESVIRGNHSG